MKQNSLTLGFLLLLGVLALDVMTFGISFSSDFSKFLFLGMILFGAFAFAFARINSNTTSLFLQLAFYSNLFLITLEMLSGSRSLIIALSCIASIAGMLYSISRLSGTLKRPLEFPATGSRVEGSEKKPLQSKRDQVEKQLGDYDSEGAKVEPYSSNEKDEITTILKEIESKAKELNMEIEDATSLTSASKGEKAPTKEEKKDSERPKAQRKKSQALAYSGKVYAGKNSKFYHTEDCPVVKRLLRRKEFETVERAEFAGLKPHDCVKGKR